jgi:hypothetical protein
LTPPRDFGKNFKYPPSLDFQPVCIYDYVKRFVCRTYCASKTDDLAAVIDHIKAKNPNAALMALGVSLGNFFAY